MSPFDWISKRLDDMESALYGVPLCNADLHIQPDEPLPTFPEFTNDVDFFDAYDTIDAT